MATFSQTSKPVWNWFPGISVLDRYIIGELVAPFLFGVGAFSSIGVAIGTVFDLVRKLTDGDIPLDIALKVFFLQLPYYVSLSFPMAMLLATLLAYARLSGDNEILALRSCGVSLYRLIAPALVAGLLVTGINFTFDQLVVPAARYQATLTLDRALHRDTTYFQERNIIYPEFEEVELESGAEEEVLVRWFYAEEFDGDRMKGLTIVDRSEKDFTKVVLAESANWNPVENNWDFYNGIIYLIDADGSYRNIVQFDRHWLPLPRAPLDFAEKERKFGEMNLIEAIDHLDILERSGDRKKTQKLKIRIHQKVAIPFACVAFGFLGSVLGTKPQRTSKATGFGISVLAIFGYYLLMSIGDALGLSGVVSPWVAGWLPTLAALAVGGILLWRSSRN